jgi:hypothetical protein
MFNGKMSIIKTGIRILNAWIAADIVNSDRPLFERESILQAAVSTFYERIPAPFFS